MTLAAEAIQLECPRCGEQLNRAAANNGRLTCPVCHFTINQPSDESAKGDMGQSSNTSSRASKACPYCGEDILAVAKKCKHCGEFLDAPDPKSQGRPAFVRIESTPPSSPQSSQSFITAGYLAPFLALIVFPPAFGLLGVVLGIVNLVRGRAGHGVAQILLSVTCGLIGMLIGFYTMVKE